MAAECLRMAHRGAENSIKDSGGPLPHFTMQGIQNTQGKKLDLILCYLIRMPPNPALLICDMCV